MLKAMKGALKKLGEEVARTGHTDKHVRYQVASALTVSEPQFYKTGMLSTVSLRRRHRVAIRRAGKIVPEINKRHLIKRVLRAGYQN